MKLSEAFPSNYLKSDDLQDHDVTVVIASAQIEMIGQERKLVLSFQGKKKSMICNKTNAGRLSYLYGDDTDGWIGKEAVLTSEFVEYQGRTVKGLRVKPPAPRTNGVRKAEPVRQMDEDHLADDESVPF
jgi:hypothetical protein